jgi:VWFA-related protein
MNRLNTVQPIAVFASLALLAYGQQPTIRTEVPLVIAPVTVTDIKGRPVDGLTADDFVLTADQKPHPFLLDTSDSTLIPISIVIAIQANTFAGAVVAKIHKVGGMIQPLITGERGEAAIVAFDEKVWTVQGFSSDPSEIGDAFRKIRASPDVGARMIDSVSKALTMLSERAANRRKVVLVISEAKDRASEARLGEALRAAQRQNVTIYAASYSAYTTPFTAKPEDLPPPEGGGFMTIFTEIGRLGKVNAADAFARCTGGRHFSFTRQSSLERSIASVGEELHSQYLLSFTPPKSDPAGYHTIDVKLRSPSGARVRTRPGYWSVEP